MPQSVVLTNREKGEIIAASAIQALPFAEPILREDVTRHAVSAVLERQFPGTHLRVQALATAFDADYRELHRDILEAALIVGIHIGVKIAARPSELRASSSGRSPDSGIA